MRLHTGVIFMGTDRTCKPGYVVCGHLSLPAVAERDLAVITIYAVEQTLRTPYQ